MGRVLAYSIAGVIVRTIKGIKMIMGALIYFSVFGMFFVLIAFFAGVAKDLFFIQEQLYFIELIIKANKYSGVVFLLCGTTIFLLTFFMLADCKRRAWEPPFLKDIWNKILITLPIVGVISYYLLFFKKIDLTTQYKIVKNKSFLKIIYNLSFGSTVTFFCIMVFFALFISINVLFAYFLIATMLLILIASSATLLLYLISILDIVQRTPSEWAEDDFLSLINPWLWIFGLRKYYLKYLLPSAH